MCRSTTPPAAIRPPESRFNRGHARIVCHRRAREADSCLLRRISVTWDHLSKIPVLSMKISILPRTTMTAAVRRSESSGTEIPTGTASAVSTAATIASETSLSAASFRAVITQICVLSHKQPGNCRAHPELASVTIETLSSKRPAQPPSNARVSSTRFGALRGYIEPH